MVMMQRSLPLLALVISSLAFSAQAADLLDAPVDRPMIQETTALGAAYLAGLAAGVYPEPVKFADNWRLEHRFKPNMSQATRERKLKGWARAVRGLLASDEGEASLSSFRDAPLGAGPESIPPVSI